MFRRPFDAFLAHQCTEIFHQRDAAQHRHQHHHDQAGRRHPQRVFVVAHDIGFIGCQQNQAERYRAESGR